MHISETRLDQIGAALAAFPIFDALDESGLAAVAAVCRERSWPAGKLIFQRGDEGSYLLAIRQGRVRLSLATPEGRELVIRHVGPGDVIGELAVIDGHHRSADAMAVEATKALIIHRDQFLGILRQRPELGQALSAYLCALLRTTNFQMESIALYDLQRRLVRFILISLRQRYGDGIPADAAISLGLTQSDLSGVLGASRPKVNHALQALIAEGALRRDGKDLICNLRQLEEIAEIGELSDLSGGPLPGGHG